MKLIFCASIFATAVSACPAEEKLPSAALQALYRDHEILQYVCAANLSCSEDEFLEGLEVTEVNLGAYPGEKMPALLV